MALGVRNEGASDELFAPAGIGFYSVTHAYTSFQRACFEYVAAHLPSIRRLVARIGSSALEEYCCRGQLTRECVAGVRGATALLATVTVGDHEDEEDEEEIGDNDDEGIEDVDVGLEDEDGDLDEEMQE